jgi:hyperosmotically inducible protein
MIRKHSQHRFAVLAAILVGGLAVQIAPAQTQPDNTGVNKNDTAVTADTQKNNQGDRYLTQQIRKAVIADKTLSTYGHNVKIISQEGTVTLKGPVKSEDERKNIVAKAEQIAGTGKVTDQLSVKAQ